MKWIMLILLILFIIPFSNAAITGIADVGEDISPQYCQLNNECQIRIQCTYNFASVGSGGTANITIFYPGNSSKLADNQAMTANAEYFTYSVIPSMIGTYSYSTQCCELESCSPGGGTIIVNPTGKEYNVSQSITYVILLIAAISLFILTLYGAIKIKWSHERDGEHKIISINKIRYFKPFLLSMAYIELMWIFAILYGVASNFLVQDNISNFFNWAYSIMLALLIPFAVCALLFSFIVFISDKKLRKKLMRGYNR
jgi:hypothetical protein